MTVVAGQKGWTSKRGGYGSRSLSHEARISQPWVDTREANPLRMYLWPPWVQFLMDCMRTHERDCKEIREVLGSVKRRQHKLVDGASAVQRQERRVVNGRSHVMSASPTVAAVGGAALRASSNLSRVVHLASRRCIKLPFKASSLSRTLQEVPADLSMDDRSAPPLPLPLHPAATCQGRTLLRDITEQDIEMMQGSMLFTLEGRKCEQALATGWVSRVTRDVVFEVHRPNEYSEYNGMMIIINIEATE
ncbi:hypothetical protein PLEOSDRAFT_169317 [Pleurotus ostreatus PC15]|uniref:Uncharacterized protein n=1 Tax=Pleurotus ostreatus (strain PC15) TaxID=1137138 RepID=A0A067NMB2_PLEO1|nr:hypothetical protein PLEOSDRAFT_169317 [Pleurotus ostreatus PC15]